MSSNMTMNHINGHQPLGQLKHNVDDITTTTIKQLKSETDLSKLAVEGLLNLAPTWGYGMKTSKPSSKSYSSGLLLANKGQVAIASPEVIQNYVYPISDVMERTILNYRADITNILNYDLENDNFTNRLLVITGPTFVKNVNQFKACAQWIGRLSGKQFQKLPNDSVIPHEIQTIYNNAKVLSNLLLSIRANLTNLNFDTNISQSPALPPIMTFEIRQGMPFCRALLEEISDICPIVGETSDTITPQYLSDLFCLGLVSSTLVESQLHRELTSGTSYPVGFQTLDSHLPFNKPMYKHKVQSAIDAMFASTQQHQFLSVTKLGTVAVVGTTGNDETFIILEVNLELSLDELIEFIENKIYNNKTLYFKTPRIMLNVGKLSNENYNDKLAIIKKLLSKDANRINYKIMGVLIDSGDEYVPKTYEVDLQQSTNPLNTRDLNQYKINIDEMNKSVLRTKLNSEDKCDEFHFELSPTFYEYFINANKFIEELDILSGDRIN